MNTSRKPFSKVIALSLVLSLLMVAASSVFAIAASETVVPVENTSLHQKVAINDITDSVPDVPMLTSAASSVAKDKQWYEYVHYSEYPVAYYYLNDVTRLAFFDPYDYASSLVMEVNDTVTDWSSNNSMQVSYTTSNSLTDTVGNSTNTTTSTQLGYTDTETTIYGENTVTTKVSNKTESYNTSKTKSITDDNTRTWGLTENATTSVNTSVSTSTTVTVSAQSSGLAELIGGEVGGSTSTEVGGSVDTNISGSVGASQSWVTGEVINTTEIEGDRTGEDGGTRTGYTLSSDETNVITDEHKDTIINEVADRITKATGYTVNNEMSLSTTNSKTVTKTYEAGYFNDSGAPLQWKIVEYAVKMPMFFQAEYLVDGEWIYGDSNYCMLTTVQGTCRAWMENNVAYYEHWGNGEPVTWDEFWASFFTPEGLKDAYANRLYPQ